MNLRFLLAAALICFSMLSVKAQQKKTIVCDKPDDEKSYQRWLKRDALYIITETEKEAFLNLRTNEERYRFIENFWLRRDPTPDTEKNEFYEEYYKRIAYANEHFSSGIPGWQRDRGLIYILFGEPDKIEKGRADLESFDNILFEKWYYNTKRWTGADDIYTFIDPTETDEFRLPKGKREEILNKTRSGLNICFMCPGL